MREPHDRIYFGAVHVKHNAEAGYAWSPVGEPHLIPTNSGRQRYNVLGAYCIQTHEHLFILTEENINFAEFCSKLDAFFANLDQYRTELVSLLAERFELVPPVWEAPASA